MGRRAFVIITIVTMFAILGVMVGLSLHSAQSPSAAERALFASNGGQSTSDTTAPETTPETSMSIPTAVLPAIEPTPTTTSAAPALTTTQVVAEPTRPGTSAPRPTTTTNRTTTAAAPPSTPGIGPAEQRVLELVNSKRVSAGCSAVTWDDRLAKAALGHSTDMAENKYFSHTSLDGRSFVDRVAAAGYPRPVAENIAKGYRAAEAVMDGWMKSSGHRANILNCGVRTMGVGLEAQGFLWTQDFGR